ncbi:MAG: recombinase A [Alphaproteobacteria bacterium]|uniref:Recombinase A n=1 Tax=Candidatus Nitrobium versatile TaxID=2884831 RepID=A0A953JBU7_9BACT|nr:recombinase A [Candidatus Nitrobium versatile]
MGRRLDHLAAFQIGGAHVRTADRAERVRVAKRPGWRRAELSGRLVELSAHGAGSALSCALDLIHDAQLAGEPCAWVAMGEGAFYPPDAAENGIDLAALPVVFARDTKAAWRAADHLLRSGGFGVVVLDLGEADLTLAAQARLAGLAKKHDAALVALTRKEADTPSLGSLVSLRAHAVRRMLEDGRFLAGVRAIKDKRRGPGWTDETIRDAPAGFR